ncbi:elongation factor G [Thermomicrobiaceae bacterium CFH 74404]|uniref:Elongation factor G n=1 Tax=Thermalbibacter longus TaxID=2951981 RepID=A0AA41WFJ8_9BACT|nr:elongation factor G [Thermalbibacter longus]MCM8749135.1 elongation factor G [Thermalbibacter longus]
MKTYPVDRLRNVGLFSHGGAGKTSLTEAMLFATRAISRMGRVEDGTTVSDWDPDEHRRGISISTSVIPIEWREHKLNILDAPGYFDFLGEVKAALRVSDAALILMDASAGVEVGTEQMWSYAAEAGLPRALLVNKLDRENANFAASLSRAQEIFGASVVPVQMPIGQEKDFRGLVDLVSGQAYLFGSNGDLQPADVPAELADAVDTYRTQLIERVCECDDDLMVRYLEGEAIGVEELRAGIRTAFGRGDLTPVFVAAATSLKGVLPLLDAIVDYFPAPRPVTAASPGGEEIELRPDPNGPLAALIFKTIADPFVGKLSYFRVYSGTMRSDSQVLIAQRGETERIGQLFVVRGKEQIPVGQLPAGEIGAVAKLQHAHTGETLCEPTRQIVLPGIQFPAPAYTVAVAPKTKSDLDKMGSALQRLLDEDPTLHIGREPQTGETLISGLGESHVQIALERMSRKFGVNVEFGLPRIPYRETISVPVRRVEYKHKKQTGGHGQYGHVFLDIEPLPDADFEFHETIVGGVVPKQFIPAVEKGVREAMEEGVLAGYPVVNVKVTLVDGSYHSVDSSEMSFKIAAAQAFKKGALQAKPILLEPVMRLRVTVPDQFTGDVMSDLNGKRAQVQGMTPGGQGTTTIEALVPAAELQRYATDLRSLTQGRGTFTVEFSHYQPVPQHLAEQVIAETKARQAAAS